MWFLEHPRWKVLLAIAVLLLGVSVRDRIRGMDSFFFQPSFQGVQGLLLYLAARYEPAAHAYRAHFRIAADGRKQPNGLLDGDAEAAERAARAALRHRPSDSDALLTLAEVALHRNDASAALRTAERLLATNPQHFDGWLFASVALARLGRYGEAIDAINEAQAMERAVQRPTVFLAALEVTGRLARLPAGQRPLCLLAHYHRWLRVHDRAQAATAVRYADEAIAVGDHPADAYLTKGIVYDLQGRDDRALAAFLKALEIDPRHAEALRWAAIKYEDRGDPVNEYRMAKASFEVAPGRPRYVQRLGYVVVNKLGDPIQAIALAEAALAAAPDNDAALRWLGHAYSLLGEHERAVEAFTRSAAARPTAEA
jgi:tetratricopeptide (TPR) repeat protein